MKKLLLILVGFCCLFIVACTNTKDEVIKDPYSFLNANFELGSLEGWQTFGDAFDSSMLSFQKKDENQIGFKHEGTYFFHGGKNHSNSKTGYMISPSFILKGNGIIGFLMGAAEDPSLTYVSFINKNDEELQRVGNESFDGTNALNRITVDLSKYLNQEIRIKIVDNDFFDDGFNYINVDDFIINFQGPYEVSDAVNKANEYLKANKDSMNPRYRLTYHAMSQYNWANDPNGVIWYNGQMHLFYQHNPYNSSWGPMHWGHQVTTDFIKWEHLPVALAPDKVYDRDLGAFSGSSIEKDGKLYLMYTSVSNGLQQQSIAYSEDGGITFIKDRTNPVIKVTDLPSNANTSDFRDPKVFMHEGMYYVIIGAKTNGFGNLLLYKSSDLFHFEYVGELLNNNNPSASGFYQLTGGIYECPDFFIIDAKQILLASPMKLPKRGTEFENLHSVVYMEGSLNLETGEFSHQDYLEIDSGFDFYAAQTAQTPDGRTIMIAWMQMWDRTMPTAVDGWAGSFTLPRELSFKNDRLYQAPVKEIENYRQNHVNYQNIELNDGQYTSLNHVDGRTIELNVEFDLGNASRVGIELFKGTDNKTVVYYDKLLGTVVFDRSMSGKPIRGQESNQSTRSALVELNNNKVKLRIFLDISSVEIFINDGYKTMTSLVYPNSTDQAISFFALGGNASIINVDKYDIIVD